MIRLAFALWVGFSASVCVILAWCVVRDRRDARTAAMRRDNVVGGVR